MFQTRNNQVKIYFYYPGKISDTYMIPEANNGWAGRKSGNYIWTVKTFGYLIKKGIQCHLTDIIPTNGIIITHRDFLKNHMKPTGEQLFVCIVADTYRHPYAQLHIVQNQADKILKSQNRWPSIFMPHWPENGLIEREKSRNKKFVNVSYFGSIKRLAPQLRSDNFKQKMQDIGFNWSIVPPDNWNDYSLTDVVLAVRSFTKMPFYKNPASKLYNAWRAGVPAILGPESAYRAEGKNGIDYIEVRTLSEVFDALAMLKEDESLRESIVSNGYEKAKVINCDSITSKWIEFLDNVAIPAYYDWNNKKENEKIKYFNDRKIAYIKYSICDFTYRLYWSVVKFIGGFKK